MQISRDHIIVSLILLTLIFFVAGAFLVLYVALYNTRKKRHFEEKELMQRTFDQELIKTQMEVQEQTLKTIAAEIHDNIGQLLSLTKLTLSSINIVTNPQKAEQKVDHAVSLLDNSIKELRQLAHLLHADNLIAAGLEKAIEKELNWVSKADRFKVTLSINGINQNKIGSKRELIAFRLFQEVLNNIIKHSEASEIDCNLEYLLKELTLTITDNGKGFDVGEVVNSRQGLGISSFFKRASVIGGDFKLVSQVGQGTKAIFHIYY